MNLSYFLEHSSDGLVQRSPLDVNLGSNLNVRILAGYLNYCHEFSTFLKCTDAETANASVLYYQVTDYERYGLVEFNNGRKSLSIEEKPDKPKRIKHSACDELQITLMNGFTSSRANTMSQSGVVVIPGSIHIRISPQFMQTIENRQSFKVACPEETAYRNGWINAEQLEKLIQPYPKTSSSQYLIDLSSKRKSVMKVTAIKIPGCLVIKRKVFGNDCGFLESYNEKTFDKATGVSPRFVLGEVFDVAVYIRKDFSTCDQLVGEVLSADKKKQGGISLVFIDRFLMLSDAAKFLCKATDTWSPERQRAIICNDVTLNIDCPSNSLQPNLATKHKVGIFFDDDFHGAVL